MISSRTFSYLIKCCEGNNYLFNNKTESFFEKREKKVFSFFGNVHVSILYIKKIKKLLNLL